MTIIGDTKDKNNNVNSILNMILNTDLKLDKNKK